MPKEHSVKPSVTNMSKTHSNHQPRLHHFLRWAPIAFTLSTLLLLLSIGTLLFRGFHWGIDFTGGLLFEIQLQRPHTLEPLRNNLSQQNFTSVTIQYAGSDRDFIIRLVPQPGMDQTTVAAQLLTAVQQNIDLQAVLKRSEFVGPHLGKELAQSGGLAIMVALFAILFYITFRFEWRLAVSSVLALTHDVIIILGALSLLNISIDLNVLAALLSVIGYSLNDTIVIFDRVRENFFKLHRSDATYIINLSLTQTLGRTLMTSATTLGVVLALLLCGGPLLYGFSFVLCIGIIVGTFSSIYVASALALRLGIQRNHLFAKTAY